MMPTQGNFPSDELSQLRTNLMQGGVTGKRVGRERVVTSQVTAESLGWPPSVGSWLRAGRNSRANRGQVKEGSGRKHTP